MHFACIMPESPLRLRFSSPLWRLVAQELAKLMMTNKDRKLYGKIMHGKVGAVVFIARPLFKAAS